MFSLIERFMERDYGITLSSQESRLDFMDRVVKEIAENLFRKHEKSVKFDKINLSTEINLRDFPSASKSMNTLYIPFWMLLRKNELRFSDRNEDQFTGPNDPRMTLENFSKWIVWINSKIPDSNPKIDERISQMDVEIFKLHLKVIQNEEDAIKAIKFVLGHEIGHIHGEEEEHGISNPIRIISKIALSSLALLASVIAILAASNVFPLFITSMVVGGIAMHVIYRSINEIAESYRDEQMADDYSAKDKEYAMGGQYLFRTMREYYRDLRNAPSNSWLDTLKKKLCISPEGNMRWFYFSHPSESARELRLEKMATF